MFSALLHRSHCAVSKPLFCKIWWEKIPSCTQVKNLKSNIGTGEQKYVCGVSVSASCHPEKIGVLGCTWQWGKELNLMMWSIPTQDIYNCLGWVL